MSLLILLSPLVGNLSAKAANDVKTQKFRLADYCEREKSLEGYCFISNQLTKDQASSCVKGASKKLNFFSITKSTAKPQSSLHFGEALFSKVNNEEKTGDNKFLPITLFTESELKVFINEILNDQQDTSSSSYQVLHDITDLKERLKGHNDEKVIFTKDSDVNVVSLGMKDYIGSKTGDNVDTSEQKKNKPLDPNKSEPIKTNEEDENGDTSEQNKDNPLDPNKTEPIETNKEDENGDNKFEQDKPKPLDPNKNKPIETNKEDENGDNRFEQDKLLDLNEENTFLTGKKAIFLVLIVTIAGIRVYEKVSIASKKKKPKSKKKMH